MIASRFVVSYKALSLIGGVALLAVLFAVNVSEAKKPPKDEPPQYETPPVQYEVIWLDGFEGASAYAIDINRTGTIVGKSDGRAVCWVPPVDEVGKYIDNGNYTVIDLNAVVPPELDFLHLFKAERISNNGLITGVYEDINNGDIGVFVYYLNGLEGKQFFYSNPIVTGAGNVYPKGINLDGTVVGVFRRDDGTFGGFAWNCYLHDLGDVYVLPGTYLATDINDSIDGDAEVVGVLGIKNGLAGDVFRWTLNWFDFTDPTADTAPINALVSASFPGPVINKQGDIAAKTYGARKNRGAAVSLLPWLGDEYGEWNMLTKQDSTRIDMNDQGQIVFSTIYEPRFGAVIVDVVDGTVWPLANPEMILDPEWFIEPAVPEAVADADGLIPTVEGFSPVVGWHYNGRAFLLQPLPYIPDK